MSEPKRIQRQRTKGWRMPEGALYVGRPAVFGNPAIIEPATRFEQAAGRAPYLVWAGDVGPLIGTARAMPEARHLAVVHYRRWLSSEHGIVGLGADSHDETRAYVVQHSDLIRRLPELRGRDLACWCPLDQPCHADVLLEIANGGAR